MKNSSLVKAAQAGGSVKPMPAKSGGTGSANNGLKQAWKDQTKSPSVLTNMDAAKKRVR
jgi:hypothetical protein